MGAQLRLIAVKVSKSIAVPSTSARKTRVHRRAPITINAKRLRVPEASKYAGMSRALLYRLLKSGEIKSVLVKTNPGAQSGIRLVDVDSIDAFFDRIADSQPAPVMSVPNTKRAKAAEAALSAVQVQEGATK